MLYNNIKKALRLQRGAFFVKNAVMWIRATIFVRFSIEANNIQSKLIYA